MSGKRPSTPLSLGQGWENGGSESFPWRRPNQSVVAKESRTCGELVLTVWYETVETPISCVEFMVVLIAAFIVLVCLSCRLPEAIWHVNANQKAVPSEGNR